MKLSKILVVGLVFLYFRCGSTSDPSTEGMSDLAVPQSLSTMTGDGKVTLWWTAQNAEDDFQGYYVFAREQTSSITSLAKYPANVDIRLSGIPRCTDNSKFFEAFSANLASTKDCKGDTTSSSSKISRNDGGNYLADSTTSSDVLTGWVNCDEDASNTLISVSSAKTTLTPQKCTVSKIAGTALKNGTTYDFFVVSVKGSSRNKISWTSNMVSDTPAVALLSGKSYTFSGAAASATYMSIAFSATSTSPTVTEGISCPSATQGVAGPCFVLGDFSLVTTPSVPTIYIGRDRISSSYQQRFFLSSHTSGGVQLQARGNQTRNPFDKSKGSGTTDDSATTSYADAGTKFAMYANQIFDFKFSSGGNTYYGKVYVESIDYSSDAVSAPATVKISMFLQPKAGETNYLH